MVTDESITPAWTFPRGFDLAAITQIAMDELQPPDLRVSVLSTTGDTLTVGVVDGRVPLDPDTLLYVARRGAFEVLRRECWGTRTSEMLVLRAWPARR